MKTIKRLLFIRKSCEMEEYLVKNKKGDILGEIAYSGNLGYNKKDWWFFIDWNPMDSNRDFWLGEDCLLEIATFIHKLKDGEE